MALSIPSTLYPVEASYFIQHLLQQHHSIDQEDTTPAYSDVLGEAPWHVAHLTQGQLHAERNLYDNGIRDGDTLLFQREQSSPSITHTSIIDPTPLDEPSRLSELHIVGRTQTLGTLLLIILGCVGLTLMPSWPSFVGSIACTVLSLAYTMLVIHQRGRTDANLLTWGTLILAATSAFTLPPGPDYLTPAARLLLAAALVVGILLLCHVVGIARLNQPPFAALALTLGSAIIGLTLNEYAGLPGRGIGSWGIIVSSILLLAAPRLALWASRVKIPLTTLIEIDLPFLPHSSIDPILDSKLRRARWLHSVLVHCGIFLGLLSSLGVLGWPWSSSYDAPNPWQWILIALFEVAVFSTALHAVYRNLIVWVLSVFTGTLVACAVVVGALTTPAWSLTIVLIPLIIMSALWLLATQWTITPVAQRVLEVVGIIALSVLFPIGVVASGLVGVILSL